VPERIYDDTRAMNIIASALLDLETDGDVDAFVELVQEVVEVLL